MMMPSCLAGKPDFSSTNDVEDLRKNLFYELDAIDKRNSVEVVKEHLQVFLRIRPFTASERSDKAESQGCVAVEGLGTVVLKAPTFSNKQNEKILPQTAQRFTFTQVFRPDCGQKQMFEGTARHLVRDFLEGRNSLVFTYGVTNAGKTFTFVGPDSDLGLLPRSLAVIFNSIEGRVFTECSVKPHRFREFVRLNREQQVKENTAKRQLLRLVKESEVHSGLSSLSSSSSSSTFLEGSSVSCDGSVASGSAADSFSLDAESNTKFSVWVSFCEIYNENIHDLLEQLPSGISRRTVLRLSQDVKGNSFVKDLHWIQVNTSDEAYRVMKVGKRNQSISATRLNHMSSRSHSIFSIRMLRIDDGVPVPRVHTISELSLCDLAGSERCARARTGGERLKEAGNINTSLLTLGKCMNALRLNQQNKNKCPQHVPFRESKLTHFLQGYFTGGGNACMIVNVSPCASAHDETINVLKFSAIAQKVVLLRPPVLVQPSVATQRSAREVSMRIDAVLRPKGLRDSMASMGWENSICLEDVEEEEDEEEEEGEESVMEETMDGTIMDGTILEQEEDTTTAMEVQQTDTLALETRIRAEVAAEFEELMNQRENDYKERLQLELQIAEDRSEKRLEIFKNLVRDTKEDASLEDSRLSQSHSTELDDLRTQMKSLSEQVDTQNAELEAMRLEKQVILQTVDQNGLKASELMNMCLDKDQRIDTLQEALDNATNEIHSMQQQLLELNSCLHLTEAERGASLIGDGGAEEEKSSSKDQGGPTGGEKEAPKQEGGRKRQAEESVGGGPARKRVLLEDEIWRLQEENEGKEQTIAQLTEEARLNGEREQEERRAREEEDSRAREEDRRAVEELKKERSSLERRVEDLTADITEHSSDYENLMLELESEQRETTRLNKENKALVNGIFQLQSTEQAHKDQVSRLQSQLAEQTDGAADLSERLDAARARLQDLESQSNEKTRTTDGLRQEVARLTQDADGLRQEVKDSVDAEQRSSAFRSAIERLQAECQGALERSAQKSQHIEELQKHVAQLSTQLTDRETVSLQLKEELSSHKADSSTQLEALQSDKSLLTQQAESLLAQVKASEESCARATVLEQRLSESEAQCAALRERLEEMAKAEEEMKTAYETASEEVSRMKASSQSQQQQEEEKGVPVVEELKEELRRLDQRRNRELEVKMKRELERLQQLNRQDILSPPQQQLRTQLSPLQPNTLRRGTRGEYSSTKKTSRKRNSTNMQDMEQSENKRPRQRGYGRAVVLQSPLSTRRDGALQMIGDIIHNSPTILGSKAKTIMSMMSGRSTDMEQPVAAEAKPKRARRKLYKKDISSPLMDMSPMTASVGEQDEKESDHHIITRKLRSRTTRK